MKRPVKVSIVSGKGGCGKTTVAISLAIALARKGYKVGIADLDVAGPNVCDILGYSKLSVENDMLIPSEAMGVKYVSIGQMIPKGLPLMWSGKDLASAAKQLVTDVNWGDLDYLILDFPPGSEETVQKSLALCDYVVFVTVPSILSEAKVRRMVEMVRETGTATLGLVKNFSYYICDCGRVARIFPEDHSFEEYGLPILAEIPMKPEIARDKVINDFDVEPFLEAMKHPIVLPKRKVSLKAKLLKALLKVGL